MCACVWLIGSTSSQGGAVYIKDNGEGTFVHCNFSLNEASSVSPKEEHFQSLNTFTLNAKPLHPAILHNMHLRRHCNAMVCPVYGLMCSVKFVTEWKNEIMYGRVVNLWDFMHSLTRVSVFVSLIDWLDVFSGWSSCYWGWLFWKVHKHRYIWEMRFHFKQSKVRKSWITHQPFWDIRTSDSATALFTRFRLTDPWSLCGLICSCVCVCVCVCV